MANAWTSTELRLIQEDFGFVYLDQTALRASFSYQNIDQTLMLNLVL